MRNHFIARLRARCRACGFTLVELMVTLAVAAVLAMIAVPSFQRLILANRLNTAANALVNAVNLARLNSIKLNATTQFCGSTATTNGNDILGGKCGTLSGAVYALPQSAGTASQVQAMPPSVTSPLRYTNAGVTAVRFSGAGFGFAPSLSSNTPYTGNIATICTSQLSSGNQRIVSMTAGSIVAVASSTGTCP